MSEVPFFVDSATDKRAALNVVVLADFGFVPKDLGESPRRLEIGDPI